MRSTVLILIACLASSAAVAAEKAPAARPASADAQDPAALAAVLTGLGAKVEFTKAPPAGKVVANVQTPGGGFGLQFVDCDATGKTCKAVIFSTSYDRKGPTLTQVNEFNRRSAICRGYLGDDFRPNLVYSTLLTPRLNAEDLKQHVGVWQGCLSEFGAFTADPTAYLLSADR